MSYEAFKAYEIDLETGKIVWVGFGAIPSRKTTEGLDIMLTNKISSVASFYKDVGASPVNLSIETHWFADKGRCVFLEPLDKTDLENLRADYTDFIYGIS